MTQTAINSTPLPVGRGGAGDGVHLVDQLTRLDSGRMRAYRDNLAFYRGQQWTGTQRRRERRLVFNYAKALVDKSASYIMNGVRRPPSMAVV